MPVRTLAVEAESPDSKLALRRTVPREGLGKLSRAQSYDPRFLLQSSGPLLSFPFLSSFPALYTYRGFYSPLRYVQASTTTRELRGDPRCGITIQALRLLRILTDLANYGSTSDTYGRWNIASQRGSWQLRTTRSRHRTDGRHDDDDTNYDGVTQRTDDNV